jgi:hypothetical protein
LWNSPNVFPPDLVLPVYRHYAVGCESNDSSIPKKFSNRDPRYTLTRQSIFIGSFFLRFRNIGPRMERSTDKIVMIRNTNTIGL